MRKSSRLPSRFPEGTKYVLESEGGIVRRYVEYPDGRKIALPPRKAVSCCAEDVSLVPLVAQAQAKHRRTRAVARV
jgi:hypothetical protein